MKARSRRSSTPATRRGPRLGVARSQHVQTAGGALGQWWSPPWLAALLVRWAGIERGMRVLDAGAGKGALAIAAANVGAEVTALEIDPKLAAELEATEGHRIQVVCADFLAHDPRQPSLLDPEDRRGFDVCLSNPVWEQKFPERFFERAAELADVSRFIVPLNLLSGGARLDWWQAGPVEIDAGCSVSRRPRFLGTKGGMRDVMLLGARPRIGGPGPVRFEMELR